MSNTNIHLTQDHHSCPQLNGKSCTCSCCREMAQLQLDMLESKRLFNEMEVRHWRLRLEKNKTHSLINKRMPPEILSTIFVYCLPTPSQLEYCFKNDLEVELSPIKLGCICRHWRDVAWSTPRLWCQLSIVIQSNESHGKASRMADLAREWLDRSGRLPLSLYIRMNGIQESYLNWRLQHYDPERYFVLEVAARYSQRWQDIYLKMWEACISELRLNITELPLLRTYNIWPIGVDSDTLWWDIPIKPQCINFHPQFDSLLPAPTFNFFNNVDWNRLNEVVVSGLPWNDYIQILKSALQMKSFTMDTGLRITETFSVFSLSTPIVHLNLRYFSVTGERTRSFKNFISLLDFPSLTEVYYDVGNILRRPTRLSQCHFPALFFSRIRDLKSLSIQLSLSLESDRFIDVLKRWPSITELFLIDRDRFHPNLSFHNDSIDNTTSLTNSHDPHPSAQFPTPLLSHLAATYLNNATAGPSQTFLPALQKLGYRALIDDPPWYDILNALGPLWDINNPRRRPLKALDIQSGYGAWIVKPLVARRLWEAKKAGIDITLRDDGQYDTLEETNDLFSFVMEKYGYV